MDLKSVFELSPAEKLRLIEDLWDSLTANPEDIPVHDWQKAEMDARAENLARNPNSGKSWDDVKREIVERRNA